MKRRRGQGEGNDRVAGNEEILDEGVGGSEGGRGEEGGMSGREGEEDYH